MQSSIPNPIETLLNSMIKTNAIPFTTVRDILETGQLDQQRLFKQIYYSLILALITIIRLLIIFFGTENWTKELVFAFRNDGVGNLTQMITMATIIIFTSSIVSCMLFNRKLILILSIFFSIIFFR